MRIIVFQKLFFGLHKVLLSWGVAAADLSTELVEECVQVAGGGGGGHQEGGSQFFAALTDVTAGILVKLLPLATVVAPHCGFSHLKLLYRQGVRKLFILS